MEGDQEFPWRQKGSETFIHDIMNSTSVHDEAWWDLIMEGDLSDIALTNIMPNKSPEDTSEDTMSSHGDQKCSRTLHGVKMQGTSLSSDLVNEGSLRCKCDIPYVREWDRDIMAPGWKRKGGRSTVEMERIKLKVHSCLLKNASLSDAETVAIENHFGTTWWWSTPFDGQRQL